MTTLRYPVLSGSEASTFYAKPNLDSVSRQALPISALILAALLLVSCANTPSVSDRVSLWKITNGEAVVYLLGSVHALKPQAYPLPRSMERAFSESNQTVFEVDLIAADDAAVAQLIQQLGFYRPPHTLQTELSADTLKLLKSHLAKKAIAFDDVKRMKPWFLSLRLAMDELISLEYDPDLGIDRYFQLKARRLGKPVIQLESIPEQLQLLASDPPNIQALALRVGIEESSVATQKLEVLIDAWRRGDADEMWRVAMERTEYPILEGQIEKLVDNRNIAMANKITDYLSVKQTTLVVVGALHIGGQKGILNLISTDYSIEQMGPE